MPVRKKPGNLSYAPRMILKLNVIKQLWFEFTYYNDAAEHVSHKATGTRRYNCFQKEKFNKMARTPLVMQ